MTVWIVNPFDNLPTEGNRPQRYWLMARAFARSGHRVVLWTSDFSHATKAKRRKVRECDDGFDVRMVATRPYPRNICLARVLSHRKLAKGWLRQAQAEEARPDVVVASTPPLGLCDAARRYAREAKAVFVCDIMDAWPETFCRIAPRWALFPLRRVARRLYTGADAISAVSRRYVGMAAAYGAKSPMHCCNHGIEIGEWGAGNGERGAGIVYVGSFGMSYDLETVIDAVRQMDDATLDIAGGGPKESALRQRAADCGRIRFHGYLGESELRDLLSKSRIGVIPMFPDSCVGIPYKLADYAAAGLKVVESLGGETGELVARYHAGCHYEAGNVESLREAIASAAKISGPNDPAFASHFDASAIMSDYVAWVENLRTAHG
ncbi:MAG: glycosyltransferase family 4 protein [Lentisphaerae bacterium]|nr:glycosyltransferase family 4 protein [Lentisphaerota bacterium]